MRRRLHTKLHKGSYKPNNIYTLFILYLYYLYSIYLYLSKKGSYKPNSPQPYLNPVFDEFDGGVIGRKISERKSSSTSHC